MGTVLISLVGHMEGDSAHQTQSLRHLDGVLVPSFLITLRFLAGVVNAELSLVISLVFSVNLFLE